MQFGWGEAELVGKRIKMARLSRGLTLESLATQVDLNKSNLSRAENGQSQPSAETLRKIEDVLHVSRGFLTGEVDAMAPLVGPRLLARDGRQARSAAERSVVRSPTKAQQLFYKDELKKRGLELYVSAVPWRPEQFIFGDLLFVAPLEHPRNRDLVLLRSDQGISLFRYLSGEARGQQMSHYQLLCGPPFIPDPKDENTRVIGVIVEMRRDRDALARRRSNDYES